MAEDKGLKCCHQYALILKTVIYDSVYVMIAKNAGLKIIDWLCFSCNGGWLIYRIPGNVEIHPTNRLCSLYRGRNFAMFTKWENISVHGIFLETTILFIENVSRVSCNMFLEKDGLIKIFLAALQQSVQMKVQGFNGTCAAKMFHPYPEQSLYD